MRIRVIQMINNYYKDAEDKSATSEADSNTALGEYCCLGHFDALHVELVKCEEEQTVQNARLQVNSIIAEKINGRYNIRNVVCVTYDDAGDEKFWKKAEKVPFLFVSLANISCIKEQMSEKVHRLIQGFNESDNIMAYYTYDHSEIAVLRIGSGYVNGFREMLSLYDKTDIFKMYTVFAIKEDELEECENVYEEAIDCRLYATVKNWEKVREFRQELAKALQKEGAEIKVYETLGNSDCLMEIPQVSIKKILFCYKMGRLLTHTNKTYQRAFFNIESQLLVEGREDERMGD